MIEKIKKMKLIDWLHLLIIFLCYVPSMIVKFIYREIWIISENGNDAKDNGYAFFKYMMKNHPKMKFYYIIDKNARDYVKVSKYKKRLLNHNSVKAIIYTMACKNYVSSQLASSFPYSNVFFNLYMMKFFHFNYIFLQHGITKENVKCFYKNESNIDLFCCAAKPEYEYVKKYFGYDDYEVSQLGFCRYDELNINYNDSSSILYMPTWRKYLEIEGNEVTKEEEIKFLNSKYYKCINRLINDSEIIKLLEKSNKTMYFCLHDNAMVYKKYFKTSSNNIKIVDKNSKETVDLLIKKCSYLITDTSSVAFDFAYLNKPVLYYQFDYNDVIRGHWKKGYFDYKRDGFGKVVTNHDECINEIKNAFKNNFQNDVEYKEKSSAFYCYHDHNNCERTFNEINIVSQINTSKKKREKKEKLRILSPIIFFVSFIILLIGYLFNLYILMLFSIIIAFMLNIYTGLINYKKNIVFLLFNISIFTFLIAKPVIQSFRGIDWWRIFSNYSEKMSLISIWVTIVGINFGLFLFNKRKNISNKKSEINSFLRENIEYIAKLSFVLSIITIGFKYICEIEKLIFMHGKNYTEFYLSYHSNLPSIINYIGGMATTFIVINLLCFQNRKKTYIIIGLYILSMVPNFIIGQRNPIVLSLLFTLIYFVIRDYYEKSDNWINYRLRICIVFIVPFLIIGLDIHNYLRASEKVNINVGESFVDFFYTQGVSYDVLNIGYDNMGAIRAMNKNYVFGPIYDYFQDNTIARKVFKLKGLGNGNNIDKAINGNSFTHILAYLSRNDYLNGHGYGSSYLLELFCNYGLLGIIAFSVFLGYFFAYIPIILRKQNLLSIIVLQILTTILFLPRAETVSSILFIFTPHFWGSLILLYIFVKIMKKNGEKNENKKISA